MVALPLIWVVLWLSASALLIWEVLQAIERRDAAQLRRHVDVTAVQSSMRAAMARAADAPEGSQAAAYLNAMATEMSGAWANPMALAEVARVRGLTPGRTAEGMWRARPVGLTEFELSLGDAFAPLTLRFALRDALVAPRWQVTAVRVEPEALVLGYAPPRMSLAR